MKFALKKNSAMLLILSILTAALLSGCIPSYVAPYEKPDFETLAADAPYDISFDDMHNEVISLLSGQKQLEIFPFIMDISVNGDNEEKSAELYIKVQDGIDAAAVSCLLTTALKYMGTDAATQDFRFEAPTSESLGSFFDMYSVSYKVESESTVYFDETLEAGKTYQNDVTFDIDAVEELTESMLSEEAEEAAE